MWARPTRAGSTVHGRRCPRCWRWGSSGLPSRREAVADPLRRGLLCDFSVDSGRRYMVVMGSETRPRRHVVFEEVEGSGRRRLEEEGSGRRWPEEEGGMRISLGRLATGVGCLVA